VTPSILTWQAHGSPKVAGRKQSPAGGCYLCCGVTPFCVPVEKWMGDNFTSQTLARCPWSQHVCEACAYVTSRVSPVLGRHAKEGKKFGGNFRNYSHGHDENGYRNWSKGEKPGIREFVEREHSAPWFLVIGESGQKHTIPFARMNGPGRAGVVLFDEQTIGVPADALLIADMIALLTLGVTKEEIDRREYRSRLYVERRTEIETFEAAHGRGRGGGWFTLALWLAQREGVQESEDAHAGRVVKKEMRNAGRGIAARASKRVPDRAGRPTADELLGANGESGSVCGPPDGERERVGKRDAAPARHRKPTQGSLF
jgi:hypothetical protein